nr:hypothetical protein [Tanacetum cinerariifolium]
SKCLIAVDRCDLKSFPQGFFGEVGGSCKGPRSWCSSGDPPRSCRLGCFVIFPDLGSSCFSQLESTLCVAVFDHQHLQVEPFLGFDQREHSHHPFYLHSNNHRDVRTEDDVS